MKTSIILKELMNIVFQGGIRENNKDAFGPELHQVLTHLGKVSPVFVEEESGIATHIRRDNHSLVIAYDLDLTVWTCIYTELDDEERVVRELSSAVELRGIEHEDWFVEENFRYVQTAFSPIVGCFVPA
ncbi:hypothetical protein D9_0245 [Aeromonas phage D9]|nr:hypothetical protein D9_0245 [Aeromonas phage D9]